MSTVIDPTTLTNPVEQVLRKDRIPTIWCPGCGIGTTVNSFAYALMASGADLKKTPRFRHRLFRGVRAPSSLIRSTPRTAAPSPSRRV